jgi:elongation factor 1-beta
MTTGDCICSVQSRSDLESVNSYLETRSYVDGYQPTQCDTCLYQAVAQCKADRSGLSHLLRWFRHIEFFGAEKRSAFPGGQKSCVSQLCIPSTCGGPCGKKEENSAAADDIDLFGEEEEEDAEAEALKAKRLEEYRAKKAGKPAVIAKSSVILDVKPWEDTTDMKLMEESVRAIQMDGLIWGTAKLVPIGYGVKKLQISCAIEDDKVSMDTLEEQIIAIEDLVQSMDIVSFNKI